MTAAFNPDLHLYKLEKCKCPSKRKYRFEKKYVAVRKQKFRVISLFSHVSTVWLFYQAGVIYVP